MSLSLSPARLAVCSWSLRPHDDQDLVAMVQTVGIPRVQLALVDHRGNSNSTTTAQALRDAGIEIVSGMFGTLGEDYSTLESIRHTGGVVPDTTWESNLARAREVADTASRLGLDLVTFHAGFLPEDPTHPDYAKLLDRLRLLARLFAATGIGLALETGQEEAPVLSRFLTDLGAPNVGVNFDPANMILYGKGDPVAAARTLLPHIRQVHIKDAIPAQTPGTWGTEVVTGTGAVDWPAFLHVLAAGNFRGALCIEREAGPNRVADILAAKHHLESLLEKGGPA